MSRIAGFVAVGLLTTATLVSAGQSASGERFEVTSVKSARPPIVNTLNALQRKDLAAAKKAFQEYDSVWNGIEVYILIRSMPLYDKIEHYYQDRIDKALVAATPDFDAMASEAKAMLATYDEAIDLVSKAAPLNPLFDDVTRLRVVRSALRDVNPAVQTGDFAKARQSFMAFDDKWDSIENLVKDRSKDAYVEIEKGMIEVERALMPEKPDANQVKTLVSGIMDKYNPIVAQVMREARAAK